MVNPERLHNAFAALDILARADASSFAAGMNVFGDLTQDANNSGGAEFTIKYTSKADKTESVKVRATNAQEATNKIKRALGGEIFAILETKKTADARQAGINQRERSDAAHMKGRVRIKETGKLVDVTMGESKVWDANGNEWAYSEVVKQGDGRSDAAGTRYTVYFGKGQLSRSYDVTADNREAAEAAARKKYGENIWITSVRGDDVRDDADISAMNTAELKSAAESAIRRNDRKAVAAITAEIKKRVEQKTGKPMANPTREQLEKHRPELERIKSSKDSDTKADANPVQYYVQEKGNYRSTFGSFDTLAQAKKEIRTLKAANPGMAFEIEGSNGRMYGDSVERSDAGRSDADTISTAAYVRSHGKQPRGVGSWAFIVDGKTVFCPGQKSLVEAKQWVRQEHPNARNIEIGS